MKRIAENTLTVEKTFKMKGQIVANPDKHQYFKALKLELSGLTLADLKTRQRQFIDESFTGVSSEIPIGGGNWPTHKMKVYDPEGKLIGTMSYNGRVWDIKGEEVVAQ